MFVFPDSSITMKLFGFINDPYKVDSVNNMTRQKQEVEQYRFEPNMTEEL